MTQNSSEHNPGLLTELPADKWEVQLRKGCLELAVLAALWDGRLYGLEMLRRVQERSDVSIAEGTVYPLLRRLKAEGFLECEWVDAQAGHPRKYYWLTASGRDRVIAMARSWFLFSGGLAGLLQPILSGTGDGHVRNREGDK